MNEKKPLYIQIKEYILTEISENRLVVGDMLPPEKDLIEQFKVSRITVRRAMDELEDEGIIARYPGKGTFVSSTQKIDFASKNEKERRREDYTIGVIMSHLDSPFQVSLLQALETAIGKHGFQMMFGLTHGRNQIENELIDRMREHGVDGLIIFPVDGAYYSEKILQMSIEDFPVVLIDRYLPGINACSVFSDDRKGGQLLGEYLIKKGHKKIALFSQNPNNTACLIDRIEGFRYALLSEGISSSKDDCLIDLNNCSVYNEPEQYENNIRRIEEFLQARPEITAVYCTIATFAINTLSASRRLKKKLEIVCFDNIEPYQWMEKLPITYISHSEIEMGTKAVEAMTELFQGKKLQNIIIPCELVVNQS